MRALTMIGATAALAAAGMMLATPAAEAQGTAASTDARELRLKMASDGLEKLYQLQPEARAAVERSTGYAVFEVDSVYAVMFVGQKGKGVLFDNATGKPTFMVSSRMGTGPGVGKQTVYQVFVFKSRSALDQFLAAGSLGGDVSGSVSTGTGGTVRSFNPSIDVYQVPVSGMAVQASWGGTVYSIDNELK